MRRMLLLLVGLVGVGLIFYSDWLSNRSDTLWWQSLPWALLVFFWAGFGVMYLRRRRGTPTHVGDR